MKIEQLKGLSVYIAQTTPSDGTVKIGFTKRTVEERVIEFQREKQYRNIADVIAVFEDAPSWLEHRLHRYFSPYRIRNELFRRDGELDRFISYIRTDAECKKAISWLNPKPEESTRYIPPTPIINVRGDAVNIRDREWLILPGVSKISVSPSFGEMHISPWGQEPRILISAANPLKIDIPDYVRTAQFTYSFLTEIVKPPWDCSVKEYAASRLELHLIRRFATQESVNTFKEDPEEYKLREAVDRL